MSTQNIVVNMLLSQYCATAGEQSAGNVSAANASMRPTVEEMNRVLSYTASGNTTALAPECVQPQGDPGFGTHIREAVEIVRDWVGGK